MALPVNGSTHLIPAYYSFIDPERMKGWVGLVGWLVADGLPTLVVTHQLQDEHRTGKVRQSETDVLPLYHSALETFVIIALYKSTFTIPYHTTVPRHQLLFPGGSANSGIWVRVMRKALKLRRTMLFGKYSMHILVWKCQTVAVLLLSSPCIHPVTHEETVILEENVAQW